MGGHIKRGPTHEIEPKYRNLSFLSAPVRSPGRIRNIRRF